MILLRSLAKCSGTPERCFYLVVWVSSDTFRYEWKVNVQVFYFVPNYTKMNWKETKSFLTKLSLDPYNKILHDIDAELINASKSKFNFSHFFAMKNEMKILASKVTQIQKCETVEEEIKEWQRIGSEALQLLTDSALKKISDQDFRTAYKSLVGQNTLALQTIEREVDSLAIHFENVDPLKILKFFRDVINLQTEEQIGKFMDCIIIENLAPLIRVISKIDDAFWHNKINVEQATKIKMYILEKYIPEYNLIKPKIPFNINEIVPKLNLYLDFEYLKTLLLKANFMINELKANVE
jgi:hypothetical protein